MDARSMLRSLPALALMAGLVVGTATPAKAGVLTVTRLDDPAPDGCAPGDCSLREAVITANLDVDPDAILLPAGTITLTRIGSDDDAQAGDLDLTGQVSIFGMSASASGVDGNGAITGSRVFDVVSGAAVISDVTIRGGNIQSDVGDGDDGGAIYIEAGSLSLMSAVVEDNRALTGGSDGGGIANEATLAVSDTIFRSNQVTYTGGAVSNSGQATIARSVMTQNVSTDDSGGAVFNNADPGVSLSISASTMSGNSVAGDGGAVDGDGPITIANSTISGNDAGRSGGGISVQGSGVRLSNVTVTANRANTDSAETGTGGGLENAGSPVTLANTIVAENADLVAPAHHDCSGPVSSEGVNLVLDTTGCTGLAGSDLTGQAPALAPLGDNGGPTPTHALLPHSPAIDMAGAGCEATDQRGLGRPDCDIGAYELVLCAKVAVNRIGTEGRDKLRGTNGPDGMLGLGGKDTLSGKGGRDGLCGGGGKDKLKGGGGKDRMKGQGGKDTCIGGGGKDRAACEREKTVP